VKRDRPSGRRVRVGQVQATRLPTVAAASAMAIALPIPVADLVASGLAREKAALPLWH